MEFQSRNILQCSRKILPQCQLINLFIFPIYRRGVCGAEKDPTRLFAQAPYDNIFWFSFMTLPSAVDGKENDDFPLLGLVARRNVCVRRRQSADYQLRHDHVKRSAALLSKEGPSRKHYRF